MGLRIRGLSALSGLMGESGFLLWDDFCDTKAAGSVDGTPAVPGPGTRTVVVDTNNKLSINGGVASVATGGGINDPRWRYELQTRVAGLVEIFQTNINLEGVRVGTAAAAAGQLRNFIRFASAQIQVGVNVLNLAVGDFVTDTDYIACLVLKSTGCYYFVKGGVFTNWTLLYYVEDLADPNSYPMVTCDDNTSIFTNSFVRVPRALWLPTPIAYDSFTRANGAIGSTEAIGPDGQASPVSVYNDPGGTWTVAGNEAINTPSLGADLVLNGDFANWTGDDPDNWVVVGEVGGDPEVCEVGPGQAHAQCGGAGTGLCNIYTSANTVYIRQSVLTVGNWYRVEIDVDTVVAGGILVTIGNTVLGYSANLTGAGSYILSGIALVQPTLYVYRSNAPNDATVDNVVAKQITTIDLFSSVESSTPDVVASVEVDTWVESNYAGLAINIDDPSNPQNYVLAVLRSESTVNRCSLIKFVAGVPTSVINATVTYAAGATLVVIKEGTSYSLYYNNAQVGTTSTISDAGIVDNIYHGMFSTYEGNQLDNLQIMPRGTSNEYNALNEWSFDYPCPGADSGDVLLLENGDNILLEDGNGILLEDFN